MSEKPIKIVCPVCRLGFMRRRSDIRKAISNSGEWKCKKCTLTIRNKSNAREIGTTRIKKQDGREQVKTQDGWVYTHVKIMEEYLGRKLERCECVHHCDKNKSNNKIDNLELMLNGEHSRLHHKCVKRSVEVCRNISRSLLGKPSPNRSLTIEQAKQIRLLYSNGKKSYNQLASEFKTTKGIVAHIVKNRHYNAEV